MLRRLLVAETFPEATVLHVRPHSRRSWFIVYGPEIADGDELVGSINGDYDTHRPNEGKANRTQERQNVMPAVLLRHLD